MSDSESGPEEVPMNKQKRGKNQQLTTSTKAKSSLTKPKKIQKKIKDAQKLKLQSQMEKKTKRRSSSDDESDSEQETEKQVKNKAKLQARPSKKARLMANDLETDSDEESDSSSESPIVHQVLQKIGNRERVESSEEDSESEDQEGEEAMASGSDEEDAVSKSEEEEGSGDDEVEEAESNSEEESENEGNEATLNEDTAEDIDEGYAALRKELSNMPFDELQQLKEKIGIKLYNQVMFSQGSSSKTEKAGKKRFKRENKNRPMEISSKRRPGRMRYVIPVKKQLVRDPRFDDLSGEYKEDIFKNTYSFLGDVKKNEKQKLLKQLNKEKDDDKKEQLEYLVRRMTAQEKAERSKDQQKERDRQRKKQEKVLVSEGKQPFYLKKSDKKKLELAEKYRELQKSGKVDTYLSKKRKKNAQKERRNLPAQQ